MKPAREVELERRVVVARRWITLHGDMSCRQFADAAGITTGAARYSLGLMVGSGYLERSKADRLYRLKVVTATWRQSEDDQGGL